MSASLSPTLLSGLALFTTLAVVSAADQPGPPRPTTERLVNIKPWEYQSSSPWGGSRQGRRDQRQFVFTPDGKQLATLDAGGWQIELWDVETGQPLGRFGRVHDPVALAISA